MAIQLDEHEKETIKEFMPKAERALKSSYNAFQRRKDKDIKKCEVLESMNESKLDNLTVSIKELLKEYRGFSKNIDYFLFYSEVFDTALSQNFWDLIEEGKAPNKWHQLTDQYRVRYEKDIADMINFLTKQLKVVEKAKKEWIKYSEGGKKAYSKEYAEFQAHKIVSAAFDKVFRR